MTATPLRSPSWTPSNSLNHDHITESTNHSPDDGETLLFSKLDITDVSVEAVEELATRVDENGDGIVKRIALGNNRLTTLPMELALLSRLRYLNLKHNSFSTFPRVLTLIPSLDTLDISHNKIRRLPNEPGKLINLRVFCFSKNKITRLPSYISEFNKLEVLRTDRNPIDWPPKSVMDNPNADDPEAMVEWVQKVREWIELDTSRRRAFDKSMDAGWRFPKREAEFDQVSPHSRSYSVDSNMSLSSITESLHESAFEPEFTDEPPPLHLGILDTNSPEQSPTRAFVDRTSLSSDYDLEIPNGHEMVQDFDAPALHTRTVSYAEGTRPPSVVTLTGKKSLPDLRKAHPPVSASIPALPIPRTRPRPSISDTEGDDSFQRSLSSSSTSSRPILTPHLSDASDSVTPLPTTSQRINSVAIERNSYFRRISKLPFSKTPPQHVLNLTESARSFLFAMCQIYQSLEQYVEPSVEDRLSVVLRKVLDSTYVDMLQFIHALERFDTTSRTTLPTPTLCRSVIEKCRNCAMAFGKAVSVLALQLEVDPGEDPRFIRWMILELHGATAEIAGAWKSMQAHIDSLKQYMHSQDTGPNTHLLEKNPALEVPSSSTLRVVIPGRSRTSRRHAGSFSYKDVEIGAQLPSNDEPSGLRVGVLAGPAPPIPTLRAPKRQATAPILSSTPKSSWPWNAGESIEDRFKEHVYHGSHKANVFASPSNSPGLGSKIVNLDIPVSTKRKVDLQALRAIREVVENAPKSWDMIEDLLTEGIENEHDILTTLEQARSITKKLTDIIAKGQDGDSLLGGKNLQEDAQLFVKVVVKISKFVKAHGINHTVPAALRSSIVKLNNLTEEFVVLLHASSFTPSSSRLFSPAVNLRKMSHDDRLASSLSRLKSAHSTINKIPHPAFHDVPHSALPTQTFKLPKLDLSRRPRTAPQEPLDANAAVEIT